MLKVGDHLYIKKRHRGRGGCSENGDFPLLYVLRIECPYIGSKKTQTPLSKIKVVPK